MAGSNAAKHLCPCGHSANGCRVILATLVLVLAGRELVTAKPRPAQKNTPAAATAGPAIPTPAAQTAAALPWLHWLLEQDGAASAIPLAWPDMMQAVSGHQTLPFHPSDPADAAVATKIGSAMDGLLPRLNRPEGAVRSAKRLALVPLLVEDEVLAALSGAASLSCEFAGGKEPARLGGLEAGAYPALNLTDQASHRTYYLGVAFYPAGQRESAVPLLRIDPAVAATRSASDGICLLLLLEHNNKSGADLAFLNWELVDLAPGKVRVQTTFQATAGEVLLPAASIADGRRGRD